MKRITALILASLLTQATLAKDAASENEGANPISHSGGQIAKGTDWETPFFIVDSGKRGPTVLIVGGMHGNEPAGSRAAEQIRHWPIVSGKLIIIPRANVLALKAKTRLTPGQPNEDANLNRNFPPATPDDLSAVKPRGKLAGDLWRFAARMKPDWVIDLHEGFEFNRSHTPPEGERKSVGSSVIYLASETMDPLVQKMVAAADATVADPAKYFSMLRRGPVSTGLTRACINVMGAESLILETTYNEQPMSIRTRQHRAMTNVLLNHIGVIDGDCSQQLAVPESNDKLQVALFDGVGTGPSSFKLMNLIDEAPDLSLFHIGPNAMKSEILKQFDVVVFPGGSGSKQGGAIGEQGRTSVREFIESGGGYVGVCAGAYLCSANYRWSLDLIDSRAFTGTVDIPEKGKKNLWYRGPETAVDIELTAKGEALFGSEGIPKNFIVRYANGPIITRHGSEALEDYQVLAWFRSENSLWEKQKGTMINTPAIISGRFGKGRVVSVSPHPELTPELHPIIIQAIRWGAQHLE